MTAKRHVIVGGAGIGGLTASLAIARNGFRVTVLEQAERLEETGAGIQLSPNAARTLIDLGLGEALRRRAVAPEVLRVRKAANGREIVRMPLGRLVEDRYGAPYWSIHRGDLQAALSGAVANQPDITLRLGMRMDDHVVHPNGITVSASHGGRWDERGIALIAADGIWSQTRERLGFPGPPQFSGRIAWRALVPAKDVAPEFRAPEVNLWLGRDAHLVHYPVKAGTAVNIVLIMDDTWNAPGWSVPAGRDELLPRLSTRYWAPQALALVGRPEAWLKWALFRRRPLMRWSKGCVTLIGDAAHPMLPYLAQGAAMAIEDAAVLAQCLARMPDDVPRALRGYGAVRRGRARKVQRLAARNGNRYHLAGAVGFVRDTVMRAMGGTRLLRNYDWLYDWRPPAALSIT
jgi:salicylate hydroxylase